MFLSVVVFRLPPFRHCYRTSGRTAGRAALNILRWPIVAVVMILGIGLLYRAAVPESPAAWLGVEPGAVVATLGWLVVSALFGVYANLASLSKTYGRRVDRGAAALSG